jgi:hypothetical protein
MTSLVAGYLGLDMVRRSCFLREQPHIQDKSLKSDHSWGSSSSSAGFAHQNGA